MLKNINYSKILFFDIETVPLEYNFKDLDERGQVLWDRKTRFIQERENLNEIRKNTLDNLPFFNTPGYCMPKPLVVENRQRPTGPFSS